MVSNVLLFILFHITMPYIMSHAKIQSQGKLTFDL